MSRQAIVGVALLLACVLLPGLVFAESPQPGLVEPQLSLRALTRQADLVLIGQVVGLEAVQDKDGVIETTVTVAAERYLKGERPAAEVQVRVPGGVVGEVGLWVPEAPQFALDEQVLLFLEGEQELQVTRWREGKYTLSEGRLAENGQPLADVERTIKLLARGDRSASLSGFEPDLEMAGMEASLSYKWLGHHWPGDSPMGEPFLVYENTADCVGEAAAVIAAGQAWSEVEGSSFRFVYGGSSSATAPNLDGQNVVRWDNLGTPSPLGSAYVWYYSSTMEIFEADIIMNDYASWSAAEVCPADRHDAQNAVTHEMGHWIGLKDLYDPADVEKTMYGYTYVGDMRKRTLHEDDMAGVRTIYPAPPMMTAPLYPSVMPELGHSEPGTWNAFTAVFQDDGGWQNIRYADLLINDTEVLTRSVAVRYDVQQNRMLLHDAARDFWKPEGVTPGEAAIVSHNYGALDGAQSSVIANGDLLTVTWGVMFTWRESGDDYLIYLRKEDPQGNSDGWYDYGDWIVNRGPTNLPPDYIVANTTIPVGVRETFNPRYKDLDGRPNLATCYFAIANTLPVADKEQGGVFLKYDVAQNKMYLANIQGTDWGGGVTPGTANTYLENEAVKVIVQYSTIGTDGAKAWIVRYRLEFKSAFGGFHRVYMRSVDQFSDANGDTGWKYKGTLQIVP